MGQPPNAARFIPASAGNTYSTNRYLSCRTVHPRERGEHWGRTGWSGSTAGSSPRARGTHDERPLRVHHVRFIPASAGNTNETIWACWCAAVHPRERGEHQDDMTTRRPRHGSSPRARGTRSADSPLSALPRFIPASAGNTPLPARRPASRPVHPRERGEHVNPALLTLTFAGSSPRARGTLDRGSPGETLMRFIPASAGNTLCASPQADTDTVHPRERGEHRNRGDAAVRQRGSSPRARGTRRW